ncbi:MAG: M14 family zinc carboxypeptidase [Planctomycetota bacterium]
MLRTNAFCAGLLVIGIGLGFSHPVLAQPSGYEGYQVVRIAVTNEADLYTVHDLAALGDDFQVWSEVIRIGPIDARIAPAAQPYLAISGLRYDVIVDDLQKYLDARFGGTRVRGFFDSLRTYNEHVQYMNDLVATYPDLAEMVQVGTSVEGRALWALRISGPGDVKPAVLYHGAEHGNEAAGSSVVAYVANYLLSHYSPGSIPSTTDLVDNVEWYLLPIMNPDGYVDYSRWNANGVDLNRNWDGPGSGESPWGGPYPFSEPETTAIRDFLIAHPTVRVHVDLHGYVPWIMWVWGHIPDHCPEHDRYMAVGAEFRDLIAAAGGGTYDIGSIYDVAYFVSGCSTNYSYAELGLWAFGIEVVDDDMPDICQEFLQSMLYLGQWIREIDCNGNGVDDWDDIADGTSLDVNDNGIPDECELTAGDMNCDGAVNSYDIDGFICALSPQCDYEGLYPDCDRMLADCNGDGDVNSYDIDGFIALVGGG